MSNDQISVSASHLEKKFKAQNQASSSLKSVFLQLGGRQQKSKKDVTVLKDINLEVKTGEFFGIAGRNGSGKSTLLKILAGVYAPTKGKVAVRGTIVPFIELGVGFNTELTARENVYLNGAMLGFSRKEVEERYKKIVSFAELASHMDKKLKNFSSGMKVRLAFSIAIQTDADVLLIDEVLAVGDQSFKKKCYDYFHELKDRGKTVIFVSHDMNSMKTYCDRMVLIEKGKIIDEGLPEDVTKSYKELFVAQHTKQTQQIKSNQGDGFAEIKKVSINNKLFNTAGDDIQVTVVIRAKKDINRLVVGMSVCNKSGRTLTGFNTELDGKSMSLAAKEQKTVVFSFKNVFPNAEYTVRSSVFHGVEGVLADRFEQAAPFVVDKAINTGHVVQPLFQVEVE